MTAPSWKTSPGDRSTRSSRAYRRPRARTPLRLPASVTCAPCRSSSSTACARETDASSLHVLFGDDADQAALADAGCAARAGVQFHWTAEGDSDFTGFLARLQREKRKKIQQEQRRVRDGIRDGG